MRSLLRVVIGFVQHFRSRHGSADGGTAGSANGGLLAQSKTIESDFDATFYAVRYPEVKGDLLEHFMTEGWRKNLDPAPWFSTSFYLQTYPDVAAAGLNPFYHYLEHGREEGRQVAPSEAPENDRSWEIDVIRTALDEDFYAGQLRSAGVDPTGIDLVLHYWREGAALGLDPTPDFSTSHYLGAHEDVAAAGVNAFAHYLARGKTEGRSSRSAVGGSSPSRPEQAPNERSLVESEFDREYYLAAYEDVAAAGVNPLDHFLANGWKERRNPNLWFSVSDYLDLYPDVAEAGINPFIHFLLAGRSEGRVPRHELGFRYDVIKALTPLNERIRHARENAPRRKAFAATRLRDALDHARRVESNGLYISVSHDDFTENFGGVQLVLMRESAALDEKGYDHLHLFPAVPLQVVELENPDPLIGVVLNRERVGFFRASEIEELMKRVSGRLSSARFAIHSLIGHRAEAIIAILKAAGCQAGWYWVHDYSSACTGYTLLRNDVEFCAGPPLSSTACSLCVYGGLRSDQMAAHAKLFRELDLTVLAPSQSALDVWKAAVNLTVPARVHQHLQISVSSKPSRARRSAVRPGEPLRVAYVGQPVTHKGWPAFRELALRFSKDPRYEFHHVGKGRELGVPVSFTEVAVGPDDLERMTRTLAKLRVDVAVLWSLWPETFCIAAVEALCAGAAVVTFKDSGNVAALVRRTGFGSVLDSEAELVALFQSGDVIELAAKARPRGLSAAFSNMTADFIGGDAA